MFLSICFYSYIKLYLDCNLMLYNFALTCTINVVYFTRLSLDQLIKTRAEENKKRCKMENCINDGEHRCMSCQCLEENRESHDILSDDYGAFKIINICQYHRHYHLKDGHEIISKGTVRFNGALN